MDRSRERNASDLVGVDDVDLFADEDVAQSRVPKDARGGKGTAAVKRMVGNVIHLEAVGHPPHALAPVVVVRDDDDLVASGDQTLRQLEDVHLHAAHVGIEEVADHCDTVSVLRVLAYILSCGR